MLFVSMVVLTIMDVFSSVLEESGALFVLITGTIKMLVLCVDSWDSLLMASVSKYLIVLKFVVGALAAEYWWYSSSRYTNVLRGVNCVGNESSLQECPKDNTASCGSSYYHATVICPGLI